jgi:hypothetical protein
MAPAPSVSTVALRAALEGNLRLLKSKRPRPRPAATFPPPPARVSPVCLNARVAVACMVVYHGFGAGGLESDAQHGLGVGN